MKLNVAVSKIAVMRIDNFVSTLKNDYDFKEEDLLATKDKMLSFVNNYLNQVFQRLDNTSSYEERYAVNYCYWNDGISPYSWVFDYKMYFNQHIAIIYNFRRANKFYENKEVKAVLDLMERMNLIEKKKEEHKDKTFPKIPWSWEMPGLTPEERKERKRIWSITSAMTGDELDRFFHCK